MSLTDLSYVVTEEAVNSNRTVDNPVWLPLQFVKVAKELTKSVGKDGNKSFNTILTLLVTAGPYKGMSIRQLYNEKFMAPCLPMFAAVMGRKIEAGEVLDFQGLIDKSVDAYAVPAVSDKGTKFNKIVEWRPVQS
jgi:hypothetical protein